MADSTFIADDSGRTRVVAEIASVAKRRVAVQLSRADRELLVRWSRKRTLAARIVLRSRIVLMLGTGRSVAAVAAALRVAPATVRLWRRRFIEHGPHGLLKEAPGRGRKPALNPAAREALQAGGDLKDSPSVRRQATELGVSAATVCRWRRRRT